MESNGAMVDPTKVGALPPPPGVTPNLVDPYSQTDLLVATIAVCLTVATPLLWARMYTKIFITRLPGWDDYLSSLAWLGFVAYCVLALEENKWGIGAHQWNVSLARASTASKLANANEIFYAPLIFVTKLSILLQYIRIFMPHHNGIMYGITHLIIWFNLLLYTAVTFVEIFQCTPRAKIWQPQLPGHCINVNVAFITTAAINIVSDIAMLILPLNAIWHLHMPSNRKWGMSAVFGTGVFACISSVMRLVESVKFSQTVDQTWQSIPLGLWTIAEICCGIVIGCLPVMPKFYRHFVRKASTKLSSSGSNKTHNLGSVIKKLTGSSSPSHKRPTQDDHRSGDAPPREYVELNNHNHGLKEPKAKPMGRKDLNVESSFDADWEIEPGTMERGLARGFGSAS